MDLYFQKVFVHQIPRVNSIIMKNEVKAKVQQQLYGKGQLKIKDERFQIHNFFGLNLLYMY